MAIILPPGTRILDADGAPVSGGKFRVYTANTTTLADVFSDQTLTTPRANPIVANAAGELPFFFIDSGTYDIAILTSADVELDSAEDVPAWGEDTGDFNRTVSGLGRIKITGSAGAVLIQIGDPDPDNSGGTGTIEGWAGTQLDTLTLDAAILNVTGRIKENGRKIASTVLTEATSFSAASTVDISLPNTPTGVRRYRVTIFDLFPSTNSQPRLKISYGGSVKGGASDYAYDVWYYGVAGTAYARGFDDAHTHIDLSGDVFTNQTNKPSSIVLEITTPNSGNDATTVHWRGIQYTNEGTPRPATIHGAGFGLGTYGRADAIQLSGSAGTWTGKYVVEALYGFGDA
jgi:hypothetical protein